MFCLLFKIALPESKSIRGATFPWALCPTHAHEIVTASFQQEGVCFAPMHAFSVARDSAMGDNMSPVREALAMQACITSHWFASEAAADARDHITMKRSTAEVDRRA